MTTLGTAIAIGSQQSAGMGQIVLVSGGEIVRSVLGSCIGVALYDAHERLGALAHVVLPAADGRTGTPGKFADTAVPWMLAALLKRGASRRRLVAKIAGGAKMFTSQGPFMIGEQNATAVRAQLSQAGIPLVGEHVAGTHGRRVMFEADTGLLTVEMVGQTTTML